MTEEEFEVKKKGKRGRATGKLHAQEDLGRATCPHAKRRAEGLLASPDAVLARHGAVINNMQLCGFQERLSPDVRKQLHRQMPGEESRCGWCELALNSALYNGTGNSQNQPPSAPCVCSRVVMRAEAKKRFVNTYYRVRQGAVERNAAPYRAHSTQCTQYSVHRPQCNVGVGPASARSKAAYRGKTLEPAMFQTIDPNLNSTRTQATGPIPTPTPTAA